MGKEIENGEILLQVKDLRIHFEMEKEVVEAVNGISFDLMKGETLGFVGETGAGKTTTALGIMRLIQTPPGRIAEGSVLLKGEDLLQKSEAEMRKIRGDRIAMIFQDPMTSLNPVLTVGEQIRETIRLNNNISDAESVQRAIQMLEMVGIPGERYNEYPHQFSGGMKQRVVIAIALSCSPELLIADEPTTALDVTIQAQVLAMMRELRDKTGTSMLMITHDLGVIAEMCDKVAIVYAGQVVEYGTVWQVFDNPSHPYIRKGIVDHAGNTFDANDVYFTVQRGCASTLKSYVWSAFDAEACKVIDDYTIDIATKEPFAPAMQYLCNNGALMVSEAAVESAGSLDEYGRKPTGGTGPWKFVEWVAGDRITLERNEDYYGDKPYFKYLVIRNITDDTTRSLSLESGDIDFNIKTATAQLESQRANPNIDIHSIPSTTLTYLCFNVGNNGPWADARVRQALRYALDMDSMVQLAFSGAAVTADSIYCQSLSCYVKPDADHTYTQNLEKAKELLAEAGYADGFEIKLWTNENQSRIDLCDMIQNAWAQIGVTAKVQIMEFATELDMIHNGEHDAFIMGFVSAGDDGDFLHDNFYSTEDYAQNTAGYKNERYDELMDTARVSLDPEVRQECYAEVQVMMAEELPWIPIANATNDYGMRATLTGLDPDSQAICHFRWVQPKDAE